MPKHYFNPLLFKQSPTDPRPPSTWMGPQYSSDTRPAPRVKMPETFAAGFPIWPIAKAAWDVGGYVASRLGAPVAKAVYRAGMGAAARTPGVKKLVPEKALNVPVSEIVQTGVSVASAVVTAKELYDVMPGKSIDKFTSAAITFADEARRNVEAQSNQSKWIGPQPTYMEPIDPFQRGGKSVGHPDAGTSLQRRGPTALGLMPQPNAIVRSWHANGVNFWRTMDGWIYVQRLDGTVKRYKPYKSVVLGKRPSSRQVNRAIRKLKSEAKIYKKLTKLFYK
jgi:hypothetical protein